MSADGMLRDQADRDLIRNALDETIVVEAAAGTGKTTELVQRILRVLATGRARIEQIVAVTFTEKAAGELKLRIRKELEGQRQRSTEPGVRGNLTDAIQRLEEAHVSTIHGFCADLLRERPVEARIDPLFEVLTEPRAERLFDEAFGVWLHEKLEDPPEGLRRALRRSVWSRDPRASDDAPVDRIRRAARELAEWRDFTGEWLREPFDRDVALDAVLLRLRELAALTASPSSTRDPLFTDTIAAREMSRDIDSAERFDAADRDGWEARVIDLANNRDFRRARKGRDRTYSQAATREEVWAAYEALGTELDRFQQAADADLAALLRPELMEVVAGYQRLKDRAGALDFVDLLLRARDLLVNHASVRLAFQARFACLFVDEFQDTDPLQAEILLLLAADDPQQRDWRQIRPVPGKLFIVGDPKQAIYRFRRADVETYREVCELLESRGARRAYLRTSFRSTPAIQRVVNASFEPLMTGDRQTLQAQYVSLSPHRDDSPTQPSVVALPVPEPYGRRSVAGYAIDKSLPDGVGAFVAWLINDSGWTITDKTSELPIEVPIQARHICILFRRFLHFGEDVTRPYVEALEARGVPHLLVGGKSFHGREEVETIRAALAAIEWPDDELSVFATLRGALFAIDDETLLEYRQGQRVLHPFRPLKEPTADLQPVVDALALLKRLHQRRNYRPVADTVTDLLNATRAHVGFVLRPAGEQALANVLHIAELARQYEINGGMSFRGFVDELRDQADGGQAAEAPILEEGSDGVRLMTAHKAKGLEFPVVVLADMTAKLKGERADRLIDKERNACYLRLGRWTPVELARHEPIEILRDEAEGVRVAYVAATRARDLLVVPVVGDAEWEGWVSPLNAGVYPPMHSRRNPSTAAYHPDFKKDSVFRRPYHDPFTSATVQPGVHRLGEGEQAYDVVWWDPHALSLGAEASFGIRRETLIMKDVSPSVVENGLLDYRRWEGRQAQAVASGTTASIAVRTVTEWAGDASADHSFLAAQGGAPVVAATPVQFGLFEEAPPPPAALEQSTLDIDVIDVRDPAGAGGARFGELVHAILASAPLDADRSQCESVAEVQARILGAPDRERDAAVESVLRVLGHDLLRRAAAAGRVGQVRRECPVTLTAPDRTLIEGVVDLAFREGDSWAVVDFKTDREISQTGIERYSRQVALYVAAIARATGSAAKGFLLRI